MPRIIFVEHNGVEHVVEAQEGRSLMQAALDRGVPGILAECGGSMACGTCHGYIDTAWSDRVESPEPAEISMLEGVLEPRVTSRLLCQIRVQPQLDGLRVLLPESQV